ncbi:MAG: CAP domain-containing protein [Candidatus Liptonbacteria bacterium]|nr:CAP domain-containing protein [Candidatus Liptonbacteria bacterium]
MNKVKLIFYVSLLVIAGLIFVYQADIFNYFGPKIADLEKTAFDAALRQIQKEFSAPPPLRAPANNTISSEALTRAGVILWTNAQRKINGGLPALTGNSELDTVATLRLDDMFKNQYFAHVSPSGSSAEVVAKNVGYDHLALGENLALGNFGGDEKVVEAWMNSPGHRANILDTHYQEIGVAVRKGFFEGNPTWIAVQIFGKPVSACPEPDAALKDQIETEQAQIKAMQQDLAVRKAEIDSMPPGRRSNGKVAEYNNLVAQYNNFVNEVKAKIAEYNSQVVALNSCI